MGNSLQLPILCLVTDHSATLGRSLEQAVLEAVRSGANLVQLRGKKLSARELFDLGRSLLGPVREAGASMVVNDRVDVALALGADGVHLGRNSLPLRDARRLVGSERLIGVSVHSIEEALQAEADGADYLVLGTIFETSSHPGQTPAGLDLVSRVTWAVRIPVAAIGGINQRNARPVMAAGAKGVAVITAILSAGDVAVATRGLWGVLQQG